MKRNKAKSLPYLISLTLFFSTPAFAEVKAISRANCVIGIVNESITYDRPQLRPFNGSVTSTHTLSLGTQFLSIVLLMSAMESGVTTLAISKTQARCGWMAPTIGLWSTQMAK